MNQSDIKQKYFIKNKLTFEKGNQCNISTNHSITKDYEFFNLDIINLERRINSMLNAINQTLLNFSLKMESERLFCFQKDVNYLYTLKDNIKTIFYLFVNAKSTMDIIHFIMSKDFNHFFHEVDNLLKTFKIKEEKNK